MPGLRRTGLAVCLWSALLLSACGGGDSSSNTGSAGAAPAESPTAPPAASPAVSPAASPTTAVSAGGQPTVAAPATSADALAGRVLFRDNCQICHGIPPDRRVIGAAGDPLAILQAVNTIRPMLFLARAITITEATHIAAWLQDPR